jgi:hypothetical protein
MFRFSCLALLVVLVGCADGPPPRQGSTCIPGDPSGSLACQAQTYILAR